jgi:hypothetical protein
MAQPIAIDESTYLYRLLHSKSDQTGAATHAEMPIMGIGAVALAAWLKASGITEGASFRRIRGSCLVEALELQGVRYIVNTLRPNVPVSAEEAGLSDCRHASAALVDQRENSHAATGAEAYRHADRQRPVVLECTVQNP